MSGNYLRSLLLIRNLRFPDFYIVYDLIGSSPSLWLAPNPSKRWGELFFLFYTPFWLTLSLGIVVPYKLYEVSPPLFNTLPNLCNYQKGALFMLQSWVLYLHCTILELVAYIHFF